jgi:hypothetical protein
LSSNSGNQDPLEIVGCAKGYSKDEIFLNLKRHSNFSQMILHQANKLPEAILRNQGTTEAKKINKMMKEIFMEAYRAKQFTRTEINDRGVLYGIVLLKHKVIDLVLEYFHERWPSCVICLYNEYTRKTSILDEKGNISSSNLSLTKVVANVSESRPLVPYFEDIQFSGEEIFETLYKSQFIESRENRPYFQKMITKSSFDLPGMRNGVEKRFRNKNLDEFSK